MNIFKQIMALLLITSMQQSGHAAMHSGAVYFYDKKIARLGGAKSKEANHANIQAGIPKELHNSKTCFFNDLKNIMLPSLNPDTEQAREEKHEKIENTIMCYQNFVNNLELAQLDKKDDITLSPFRLIMIFANTHSVLQDWFNQVDADGFTLLHYATVYTNAKTVEFLLNNGAKSIIDKQDPAGNTPLHWTCNPDNNEAPTIKAQYARPIENSEPWKIRKILFEHGAKRKIFNNQQYDYLGTKKR